jgi:competence protein ComEA
LPGVGPTLAGRIIDWKAANGNFSTVEDLLKVSGIGDKLFARIRTMVRP